MKQHPSLARRCAAVVATAALVAGAGSLASPAEAAKAKPKKGSVTDTVALTCNVFGTDFDYAAKIKLSGTRAPKAKSIKLKATMSKFPGVSPVAIDNDTTVKLGLKMGSAKVTLKGKGHSVAEAGSPVPVPAVSGTRKTGLNSFKTTVTSLAFTIPDYSMTIACVPAESGALGTLRLK